VLGMTMRPDVNVTDRPTVAVDGRAISGNSTFVELDAIAAPLGCRARKPR
jgi:hypothetical protein